MNHIDVKVTRGRGLRPDELSVACLNKIIQRADAAPAPIRDQVHALRSNILAVIASYLKQAVHHDRMTLYNKLMDAGQEDAAKLIMKL